MLAAIIGAIVVVNMDAVETNSAVVCNPLCDIGLLILHDRTKRNRHAATLLILPEITSNYTCFVDRGDVWTGSR
jgi:hypothetical protein